MLINKERTKAKRPPNKRYCLNPSLDEFEINKVFITSFLNGLWNYPEAIYHILNNSEIDIVKSNLASFIANNFYCNHLSGNYMENNLLYVITMMLKDEIDKLDNINQVDKFLENTKCGYLLEELQNMPDIHIFFKNVIVKAIEKIERTYSFNTINLNFQKIINQLNKLKESEEKKMGKKRNINTDEVYKIVVDKILNQSINISKEEHEQIIKKKDENINKYMSDINIKEFENRAEKAKKENKNNLYEYYISLINDIKKNNQQGLYSNTFLNKNIYDNYLAKYILPLYKNDLLETINFINQLIEDLMKNILLLPNSIKYICKIISILIKNKFKEVTEIQINAFISKFFLEKLLIPTILSPKYQALIDDFIISENTLKNIKTISFILKKLFSGNLFHNNSEEGYYTPFNWLFIDKMENILHFFEKAVNTNLPNFIEKYINNQLSEDYSYEFFNENPDEICANISICFSIDNLYDLINGLKKSEDILKNKNDKIKKLKRAYEKLKSEGVIKEIKNVNEIKKVRNKESLKNKDKYQNIEIENFYLYNELEKEKKYSNLFSINNKNFYINVKKDQINKLDENEKNIIKIKNYLCNSLGNYKLLNKSDFNIGSTSNTINILDEIKSFLSLPNFILYKTDIPSIWYLNSIINYLQKLPEEYKKNEYKKLFRELTENLNDSIRSLDFEKLILFRNKLKFIDKMNNYYDNVKELINNILINENIKYFVEESFIPVDIIFKYENEEKKFEITKSNIKEKLFEDKIKYEAPKKKFITFRTIEAFTRYFPDLTVYESKQDINTMEITKELLFKQKINNYFEIIKDKISKSPGIDENLYETVYKEKIKDYVMNKIYDKIYPSEPAIKDYKIYQKSIELSWVEPKLIIKKEYIFDDMLPDILNEFNQINIMKTPIKKLNCIKKIIAYIEKLIKFNEGEDKEIGAEDITPVLNYIFIKAQPFKISSDIEFIKIFMDNINNENNLANIESMCDLVLNCTAKNFNLTQEEYNEKVKEARNNDEIKNKSKHNF